MALEVARGILNAAGATQTITTGFFTPPKFAIFVVVGATVAASGAAPALTTGQALSVGFTDFTNHRCHSCAATHGATSATLDVSRYAQDNAKCIHIISPAGVTVLSGVAALSGNNVVITWTGTVGSRLVEYLIFGGTDITNVTLGGFLSPAANVNLDVSLGYNYNFLMFLNGYTGIATPVGASDSQISVGYASADGSGSLGTGQGATAAVRDNAAATTSADTFESVVNASIAAAAGMTGSLTFSNNVTPIANGFRVTGGAGATAGRYCYYLAVRGLQAKVGSFVPPVMNGLTTVVTTGLTEVTKAVMLQASGHITPYPKSMQRLGIGMSTAINTGSAAWIGGDDAVVLSTSLPSQNRQLMLNDAVMYLAGGATGAVIGRAALTTLVANGFTLTWPTAPTNTRECIYVAFAPAGLAPTPINISSGIQVTPSLTAPQIAGTGSAPLVISAGISVTPALSAPGVGGSGSAPLSVAAGISVTPALTAPVVAVSVGQNVSLASGIQVTPTLSTPGVVAAGRINLTSGIPVIPSLTNPGVAAGASGAIVLGTGISVTPSLSAPGVARGPGIVLAFGIVVTPSLTNPVVQLYDSIVLTTGISVVPTFTTPTLGGTGSAPVVLTVGISVTPSLTAPSLSAGAGIVLAVGISVTPSLSAPVLAATATFLNYGILRQIDSAWFPGGQTFYLEATIWTDDETKAVQVQLASSPDGVVWTPVIGSIVTSTAMSAGLIAARRRSTALLLTPGNYWYRVEMSSGVAAGTLHHCEGADLILAAA